MEQLGLAGLCQRVLTLEALELNGFSTTIGPLYDGTGGTAGGGTGTAGGGIVTNSAAAAATLRIITNQIDGPETFSGAIAGPITLDKEVTFARWQALTILCAIYNAINQDEPPMGLSLTKR
jgi:hypothetical protein